ncbi:unnamed protein product [Ascophyllum nodosum]
MKLKFLRSKHAIHSSSPAILGKRYAPASIGPDSW